MSSILYEHTIYYLQETRNPTYLIFHELSIDDKDLYFLEVYLGETMRWNNKWWIVRCRRQYFRDEATRDSAVRYYFKPLYKREFTAMGEVTK